MSPAACLRDGCPNPAEPGCAICDECRCAEHYSYAPTKKGSKTRAQGRSGLRSQQERLSVL
jgi:hypothetical protein